MFKTSAVVLFAALAAVAFAAASPASNNVAEGEVFEKLEKMNIAARDEGLGGATVFSCSVKDNGELYMDTEGDLMCTDEDGEMKVVDEEATHKGDGDDVGTDGGDVGTGDDDDGSDDGDDE